MTRHREIAKIMRTLPFHIFAVLMVLICVVPVLEILNWSLSVTDKFHNIGFSLSGLSFRNYTQLFQTGGMSRWVLNSFVVCIGATALELVVDLTAAFAFAKLRFRGRQVMFLVLVSTMMLPFSITLVPTYLLVAHYGMVDTYAGLIIPAVAGPFGVFLLRQFMLSIPDSLIESATIDGASKLRVFRSIIAPLCAQPVVVLAIFTFVNNWNSFLWPLLITNSDSMKTLTVGLATTNLQFSQNVGGTAAGAMLSLIPMAILFAIFQRFFLQGITSGAIK